VIEVSTHTVEAFWSIYVVTEVNVVHFIYVAFVHVAS
jgi:hypothetical protein